MNAGYSVLDIAGKYLLLSFKLISKIEHIYVIEEGLAGEQSALTSVAN
jgi:hypothetical protein